MDIAFFAVKTPADLNDRLPLPLPINPGTKIGVLFRQKLLRIAMKTGASAKLY
jgi:hypothetical protein